MSRLTRVQQDVIDRLRDGWELHGVWHAWVLRKPGEASRHVADSTVFSLLHRHKALKAISLQRWVVVPVDQDGAA